MSRYLIQRLPPQQEAPADELHVRFTLELPDLSECHRDLNFALDWIKTHPASPPTILTPLLELVRNFLPPPKPP